MVLSPHRGGKTRQNEEARARGVARTLRAIAERSGGRYFAAEDADALADVVEEIDRLERTEITEVRYLEYEHHFAGFVTAALACLGLGAGLAATVFRRLP